MTPEVPHLRKKSVWRHCSNKLAEKLAHLRLVIHIVQAATAMPVPRTEATTIPATLPGARFWLSCWIVIDWDFTVPVSPAAFTALTAM